jgi:aspartate kinase
VISRENLHNEDRLRRALTEAFGAEARLVDGLGAVSIVGTGINATYQNVRRGVTCLQENGIQSFGLATSSFRATWLIERGQLDEAVRLLHALFIESPPSLA